MVSKTAPALQALLERFIDYAGLFPPAALGLTEAVANYNQYSVGYHSWMLRFLVVPAADLPRVPDSLTGTLSVLADNEQHRAAALETKGIVQAKRPVYCEVLPQDSQQLDAVKAANCFAKIRTGGVKPEAIPEPETVAAFILGCAQRKLPFKATAGLHHPIRAVYPLTYEADAPKATMHGFLNLLLAAAFAWHGDKNIEAILSETDPASFLFDDRAHWQNKSLSIDEIRDARTNFVHSVGSCSFDEPVHELQALGLLD